MTHLADHVVGGVVARRRSPAPAREASPQATVRCRDPRWPALTAALAALRETRRCSVRIVDADCGRGTMLLCAARHARALGFTAIEARGIDDAPALVAQAQAAAAVLGDPAIGISFAAGDIADELAGEAAFPADIVLWHRCRACDAREAQAVAAAGRTLIADAVNVEELAA